MPIYIYQNPETEEYKEVVQTMNEEHVYAEDGVDWKRIFTIPNASIDTKLDAFDKVGYIAKTGNMKGTVGDALDYSAELSQKREEARGEDPVKRQMYDNYKKTTGQKHLADKPKKIETKHATIEF